MRDNLCPGRNYTPSETWMEAVQRDKHGTIIATVGNEYERARFGVIIPNNADWVPFGKCRHCHGKYETRETGGVRVHNEPENAPRR